MESGTLSFSLWATPLVSWGARDWLTLIENSKLTFQISDFPLVLLTRWHFSRCGNFWIVIARANSKIFSNFTSQVNWDAFPSALPFALKSRAQFAVVCYFSSERVFPAFTPTWPHRVQQGTAFPNNGASRKLNNKSEQETEKRQERENIPLHATLRCLSEIYF